jgi:hypothetical protein
MSEATMTAGRTVWRGRIGTEVHAAQAGLDARRALQLALAGIWLVDAMLQYQSVMFTKAFGQMLAASADGNPAVIARPIRWDATLVGQHVVLLNAVFATIQLLLGLGIAFRPTVRLALAASLAWSVGVWWFGEGLGGVLNGGASPVNGAPGAVILYALLAVLLWPAAREPAARKAAAREAPFVAARAVGARAARALWLVLWLSLAYFSLTPDNRAPQALNGMIAGMESGEPGWLAAIDRGAAALVAQQGLAASIVLAAALAIIAVAVYLPPRLARAGLLLAIVVAAVIWVAGQDFGMILAGGATDVNSGPLLALLALAYWPARTVTAAFAASAEGSAI